MTMKEETPPCFAKDWDKNSPECAGGPDTNYVAKGDGTDIPRNAAGVHVRTQCSFFQTCGTKQQTMRFAQTIPTSNLLRQVAPQQLAARPQQLAAPTFGAFAQQLEASRQNALAGMRPPVQVFQPPPLQPQYPQMQYPQGPMQHPAQNYALNYQMPGYLTVPEMREPGESVWYVVGREVLRSMMKAFGHAFSHGFDTRTFKG